MRPPRVHIGIVTYNSLRDLPRCFEGLQGQTYPNFGVTVLDNASTDGSVPWLREHAPHVDLLLSDVNLGYGNGHNRIVAQAQEGIDYYMPLNPDVFLKPGYISNLLDSMSAHDAAWGIGKLLLQDPANGRCLPVIYSIGHALRRDGYAINIGHGLPDADPGGEGREVFGAPGAASLISTALIDDIAPDGHLFDPSMFMYNEDVDFDWRARLAGWRCWHEPTAVACHRGSVARGYLRTHALVNRYLSVLKNAYPIDLITYNLPLLVVHCLLKLVLYPRQGAYLIGQLLRHGPRMLRKRQPASVPRRTMRAWFQWSRRQPSNQPRSWLARLRHSILHQEN